MAYVAVASLSETIDIILNYHQDYTTPQFQNQIISLREHSVFLQSFLEEFPDRGNNWDETIREVTDRAEEIVELSLSDSLLESKSTVASSKSEVDYDLHEMERVTEEMESVVKRVKVRRQTEVTVGSDEELMQIISRLRGGASALEIIPIVGLPGIGKTTLASNAYDHPLIVRHFDIRSWSYVSQAYSRRGTISELLRFMKAEGSMSDSEDEMMERVYKRLYGKRYLIVLDDIWSWEAWDSLKLMFPDDRNGSRIILTTRSRDVASYASLISRTHIHDMRFLDEATSWNVVREKIFKGDPCPSQLEYVGKEIARSCRGHPLSIQVVSSILAAADQTEAAWKDVLQNMEINVFDDDQDYRIHSWILSVSYTYLPHHLRPCFLYLGIFPQDDEIHVSKLIKLWVAEGFLNESEHRSYEEIGEERVEELVRRSLVSVSKRKFNGRIKSIIIHYLMREVCLTQAKLDNFILQVGWSYARDIEAEKLQSYRRVSTSTYNDDIRKGVYGSTIRTIMLNYRTQFGDQFPTENVRLLRMLRILDLSNAYNYDLPDEVFDLFHLRYLAFHCGFIISEAISNLENLQTLIICPRENDGGVFGKLPEGVWRMPQLRHVILFPFELPRPKGLTACALENLQTLSRVVDFICSRENLKMIPNLKKLALLYTKKLRDVEEEDLELHNLIYLHKLESLKIDMDWLPFGKEHKMSTHCAFPPTLKKLNLCGVQLPWEDMKIVSSLPNLQVLKLRDDAFIGETWETSDGGFHRLEFLLIDGSHFENWITESSHFPKLRYLMLHHCWNVVEIPEEIGDISALEFIEVDDCNPSLISSAKEMQHYLDDIYGDSSVEVRFITVSEQS